MRISPINYNKSLEVKLTSPQKGIYGKLNCEIRIQNNESSNLIELAEDFLYAKEKIFEALELQKK